MKNHLFKNVYAFFTSFLIFILHLPFVFANTKPVLKNATEIRITSENAGNLKTNALIADIAIFDRLHLNDLGLSEQAFQYALKGFNYLVDKGKIINDNVITIADFTKPSGEKRLFVIDLQQCKILFNTYVAHGQGSGKEFANRFSNIPESYQSSLGFYVTSGTYIGKNGYSLHLNGLENGINDKADERAIVMHGAPYVNISYISAQGYIGRSWGCPAVPEKLNKPIIDKIKNGSCLFIYSNNKNYLSHSKILNS